MEVNIRDFIGKQTIQLSICSLACPCPCNPCGDPDIPHRDDVEEVDFEILLDGGCRYNVNSGEVEYSYTVKCVEKTCRVYYDFDDGTSTSRTLESRSFASLGDLIQYFGNLLDLWDRHGGVVDKINLVNRIINVLMALSDDKVKVVVSSEINF